MNKVQPLYHEPLWTTSKFDGITVLTVASNIISMYISTVNLCRHLKSHDKRCLVLTNFLLMRFDCISVSQQCQKYMFSPCYVQYIINTEYIQYILI